MVELVHNNVIIEFWRGLCGKVLRIEGLDRDKQIVDALGLIAAHKHLSKVGIFENSSERAHALLEDFFSVCHK